MSSLSKTISAFSLIEMMIVMAIVMLLLSMSIVGIRSTRSTIDMTETYASVVGDIRNTRTSALLLQRNSEDRWIYGIGIDFGDIGNNKLNTFKWCSPFFEYGQGYTDSALPNFDPDQTGGTPGLGDLKMPTTYTVDGCHRTGCDPDNPTLACNTITKLEGVFGEDEFQNTNVSVNLTGGGNVRFVLFEALSGRAFFYDQSGHLVNFDSTGAIVPQNQEKDLELTFTKLTGGGSKKLVLHHISGWLELVEN